MKNSNLKEEARTASSSEKFHKLFNGETCLVQDLSQGARPNLFMIRNHDARIRVFAPQYHVTPFLPVQYEAHPLERCYKLMA